MIHKALRSSDLNQMICYMRSSDLNQMIHESAPKFQSESNDSRYAKSDLNQMIHEPTPKFRSESNDSRTHSKVPIWIKWFAIRKVWSKSNDSRTHPKSWSESNDLRYATQLEHFQTVNHFAPQWFNWFEVSKISVSPITMCFIKSLQAMSKLENEWLSWSGFG